MHLTVAGYQLEREDIAIFDDNGFTAQTGSQRSRGVEVELAGSLATASATRSPARAAPPSSPSSTS